MVIDTVLFDLDDTIHDRKKSILKFIDLMISEFNLSFEGEKKLKFKNLFIELDSNGYRSRTEVFNKLIEIYCLKMDIDEIMMFWNSKFPLCAESAPNLYSVLDYISREGLKMGIITNGESDFQNKKIDILNLRKSMKTIIISEDVGLRKPNAQIFKIALEEVNSKCSETLFVGDNPYIDIKGANDAGLISIWLSHGQTWNIKEYQPHYVISQISELSRIIADC